MLPAHLLPLKQLHLLLLQKRTVRTGFHTADINSEVTLLATSYIVVHSFFIIFIAWRIFSFCSSNPESVSIPSTFNCLAYTVTVHSALFAHLQRIYTNFSRSAGYSISKSSSLINDACENNSFLIISPRNAGMLGGSSKLSCRLDQIILAHKRNFGISYLFSCFSFNSM